nr:PIN domain-containing protein [Kineosphaera limosa]
MDANILVRAVLGRRVKELIATYAPHIDFVSPTIAYEDAERHLPEILTKHGRAPEVGPALDFLFALRRTVTAVPEEAYESQKVTALARIAQRDSDDWPVLATAILLRCPIWTEDNDFFGTGVPTWTTDRVELYLKNTD